MAENLTVFHSLRRALCSGKLSCDQVVKTETMDKEIYVVTSTTMIYSLLLEIIYFFISLFILNQSMMFILNNPVILVHVLKKSFAATFVIMRESWLDIRYCYIMVLRIPHCQLSLSFL